MLVRFKQVSLTVWSSLSSTAFLNLEPLRKHDQVMLGNDLCLYTSGGWVCSHKKSVWLIRRACDGL